MANFKFKKLLLIINSSPAAPGGAAGRIAYVFMVRLLVVNFVMIFH